LHVGRGKEVSMSILSSSISSFIILFMKNQIIRKHETVCFLMFKAVVNYYI
jgi:hypothetical protein